MFLVVVVLVFPTTSSVVLNLVTFAPRRPVILTPLATSKRVPPRLDSIVTTIPPEIVLLSVLADVAPHSAAIVTEAQ